MEQANQPEQTPISPVEPSAIEALPRDQKKSTQAVIAAAVVVVLGTVVLALLQQFFGRQVATKLQEERPSLSTPTPIRLLSPVTETSAFQKLDTDVASLSAALSLTNRKDPILTPPAIEYEFSFTQ